LKQISCCAPRFPLILTAKFHSLNVKELEVLETSELDILHPTPQPWWRGNHTFKILHQHGMND